eukprot:CAMPEP_0113556576 /NCGR_PEP_ID=MMETSP0015_2-20120614/17326_1 /TAXON_ID=2838 /ORGANISM="Odontella" /LENGTH=129 /DNA_ID=CAMNT_0000457933 /DNA_START=876 /DNA_END=1262 /DNA_ORIENTATION=- /assembly_acc=CAM_ASM_000160
MSKCNECNVSNTYTGDDACAKVGINKLGITKIKMICKNLTFQELFKHAQNNGEGWIVRVVKLHSSSSSRGTCLGPCSDPRLAKVTPHRLSRAATAVDDIALPPHRDMRGRVREEEGDEDILGGSIVRLA